jgi:hypothetical protein
MDTSRPPWVRVGKSCERPKNVFATPKVINDLTTRWRLVALSIMEIVRGREQENENAYVRSGDNLAPLIIPCLSQDLILLTTQMIEYGKDLYPWFDPKPLWDFWIGVERWHSDRSPGSSLRLEAEYRLSFSEQHRLFHATAEAIAFSSFALGFEPLLVSTVTNGRAPEAPADRPELVAAAAPSGNRTATTNGHDMEAPAELPDLVTLNQAAAIVHCSKRTMERHRDTGKLPVPIRKGKNGKAHLYDWKSLRSALEELFDMNLPEKFPANRENVTADNRRQPHATAPPAE